MWRISHLNIFGAGEGGVQKFSKARLLKIKIKNLPLQNIILSKIWNLLKCWHFSMCQKTRLDRPADMLGRIATIAWHTIYCTVDSPSPIPVTVSKKAEYWKTGYRARICKRLWSPEIDSDGPIPPAGGPVRQIGLSYRLAMLGIDSWAP